MHEINIYTEKIGKNTFKSSDIPLLLKVLRQDAKAGNIELSREDIHLFQVYMFSLQQLELSSGGASKNVHEGDWRDTVDDLSVLRKVIDEMENQKIITNIAWNAGGMAIFDIPDKESYRTYIYSLILGHLKKLYEEK